jgi:hypothetical protein
MKRTIGAVAVLAAVAGGRASAHHSYAACDTARVVEFEGVIDEFRVMSPHTLLTVKAEDGRLYTGEWLASAALKRSGIDAGTLKAEERIVIRGNPRRDFNESGLMILKAVLRPSDGWTWGRMVPSRPAGRLEPIADIAVSRREIPRRSHAVLLLERRPVLEFHHDELRGVADVLRQVNVAVAASQRATGDGGRLGGSVGEREVKSLVSQKDHASREMPVHDRFLASPVLHAQEPRDVVLE